MPEVKITTSAGLELVYFTTIHIANSFVGVVYDGLPLDIIFKKDDGMVRYHSRSMGPRVMLELFNFNNSLGEGMLDPIPFAESNGRDIKMSFFVQTLNAETFNRVISLNFFAGPQK